MMFLNNCRWRGSAYAVLAMSVSGAAITWMSSRKLDAGIGRVLSYSR